MSRLILFDVLYALQSVAQVTGEAQSPEHYRSHTAAGLSTTEDDGMTPTRKLEVSLGGGKGEELK